MPRSLLRRHPALARLVAAETISPIGNALAVTALILDLQRRYGRATPVAALLLAETIPPLLAPVLGAAVDRFDRRRVLAACAAGQAALVTIIGLTLHRLPFAGLLALMALNAAMATITHPLATSTVPDVIDDEHLPRANALLSTGRESGTIIGPPLAGLLFPFIAARGALVLDALTFLAVIPLVLSLPAATRAADDGEHDRVDWRSGGRWILDHRIARILVVAFLVTVVASAGDDLFLPFLAKGPLGAGSLGIGILLAAASVGLLGGLPVVSRLTGRAPRLVVLGFVIVGTANFLTGAAPVLVAAIAFQMIRGVGIAFVDAHFVTLLQREAPPHLRAAVLSTTFAGIGAAAGLSYAIGGPLMDATSPRVALGGGGLATVIVASVAAVVVFRSTRDERRDGRTTAND